MNIVKTIIDINGNLIFITQDDLDQDAREQAWKQQRNQDAARDWLRRNPSGRVA